MADNRTFKRGEIKKITGLTLRQVGFYSETPAKAPVVVPNGNGEPGTGKKREYSRHNLLEFLVVRECTIYGLTVGKIKTVIQELNAYLEKGYADKPGNHWLVVRHKREKQEKKDVMVVSWMIIFKALSLKEFEKNTSALFINIDELREVAAEA